MTIIILIGLCTSLMIIYIVRNKIYIKTATMAIVMALGIFTEGVLASFFESSFLSGVIGMGLTVFTAALWLAFSFSLCLSMFAGKFTQIHLKNIVNRFAIGTWVAGTSIYTILLHTQFHWVLFTETMLYLICGLWMLYMVICVRSFYDLISNRQIKKVHGALLLSTVSTQSLVLVLNRVHDGIPSFVNNSLIFIGMGMYVVSLLILLIRYISSTWKLADDWNNTNCILHGALSITGMASIVSTVMPQSFLFYLWIWIFITFCIVESIEVFRIKKRVEKYGVRKALFVYDVTQWSRVFTFGMFYTFTSSIDLHTTLLESIQQWIIFAGGWVIALLLAAEFILFLVHKKANEANLKTDSPSPADLPQSS